MNPDTEKIMFGRVTTEIELEALKAAVLALENIKDDDAALTRAMDYLNARYRRAILK